MDTRKTRRKRKNKLSVKIFHKNESLFASKKHTGNELLQYTKSSEMKLKKECSINNLSWFGNYKVAKQYKTKQTVLSEFKFKHSTILLKINRQNEQYFKSLFSNKLELTTAISLNDIINYDHPYVKMNKNERAYYEFCFVFGYLSLTEQYEFMKFLVYLLKENVIQMHTRNSKSILNKLQFKINYYKVSHLFSNKKKYNRLSFYELDKCAVLNVCKLVKFENINIDGLYQKETTSFWFPDLIVYKMNIEETILFNPHNNLEFHKLIT